MRSSEALVARRSGSRPQPASRSANRPSRTRRLPR
ncbi:hypothetical protein EYF80_059581 [Liparis tanakae]|uniref:Uncharacterized protein n=1 Tax=Liparis tanakae TaxID=230148 RepID=A0A4Z2EMV3_9TELE|nr:hypothetical protein EYF80_059581 [Liparis tanakae]